MYVALDINQRSAALDGAIRQYIAAGFRVASQTPVSAQLVRPKQFSCAIATLSLLVFGVGFLIYIFYFAAMRDDVYFLTVDESGNVQATSNAQPQNTALLVALGALLLVVACAGFLLFGAFAMRIVEG